MLHHFQGCFISTPIYDLQQSLTQLAERFTFYFTDENAEAQPCVVETELEPGHLGLSAPWEGHLISLGFSFFVSKIEIEVPASQKQCATLVSRLAHRRCLETCQIHTGFVSSAD